MSEEEKVMVASFAVIAGLTVVLIAIIGNYPLFPEILFYSLVVFFTVAIFLVLVRVFLWNRASRYIRMMLQKRRHDILARKHFEDFREFVVRFTRLPEFSNVNEGITSILSSLLAITQPVDGAMIDMRIKDFGLILQNPLNRFRERLEHLHWREKEINYEFLSCLAKEFENYVALHKGLYVDWTAVMARKSGLNRIHEVTKRIYSNYKDDYNQFIVVYTEFANKTRKECAIFSQYLQKASEL